MTDKPIQAPCRACGGTGKATLSGSLLEVFLDVETNGQVTAQDIFGRMSKPEVSVNAVNNRLEALRRLGLLDRERIGRAYLYRLQAPAQV